MKKRLTTFILVLLLCTTLISCFPTYDSRHTPLYVTIPTLFQEGPMEFLSFAYYRNNLKSWGDTVHSLKEVFAHANGYQLFDELVASEQELYQYVTLPQRIFGPFTGVFRACVFHEDYSGLDMIYYQTTRGNYILFMDTYDNNQLYLFPEKDYCALITEVAEEYRQEREERWEAANGNWWEAVLIGSQVLIGNSDADLSPYKIEPRAITWWQCALIDIAKVGISAFAIALIIYPIRKIRKRKQEKQQQATESAPTEG